MGGQAKTLAGLAGLGDLVLTCSGDLCRNRHVGKELAAGRSLAEIMGSMRMVAEGVETCDAAVALGEKFGVDLPIIQQMHAVLKPKSPQEAVRDLMDRSLKGRIVEPCPTRNLPANPGFRKIWRLLPPWNETPS